ncbi:hypothetical protein TTHERM_00999030 (macronuclear) [Tetrahymena thermophila SB210]|uniref:Uncharacterized protein n=1 Tax=Tetrahymena thermophila (strain SB210) TaxID=312017 RepID=Q22D74_TETTS|nr:hypothetical protein TTHERM_00999030 [Tetrahymena thermophila SB210]EAR83251.2 hypothetical protein TTHERM_00999030 [Tetrahymena thermophila SB210]|eukprot:XP_001030914.2 hypothetical protein TTHERM_00999030 [Tetrahymena thermophila SB210]
MYNEQRDQIQIILNRALLNQVDQNYEYRREINELNQLLQRNQYDKNQFYDLMLSIIQTNQSRYNIRSVLSFLQIWQNSQDGQQQPQKVNSRQLAALNGQPVNQQQEQLRLHRIGAQNLCRSLLQIRYNHMRNSFYQIRQVQLSQVRRHLNCSQRIKGQILQMIFQRYFPAELKKKEFFYRWRVRCNIIQPRNVIKRLVLYARIQPEIAYWRLRSLISNPYEDHIVGKKIAQFEDILENTKKAIYKKFQKQAFVILLKNQKRQKNFLRLCELFEKKMNKLFKKIGFRVIKLNQRDYLVNKKFIDLLANYAKKKTRAPYDEIKKINEEGEEKKKRAVYKKLNDNLKVNITEWRKQANQAKQYMKCRLVMKFLETLNKELVVNTMQIFQSNREQILKKQAIEKMFGNFNQFARKLLNTWRVNARFGTLNRDMIQRMIQNLGQQVNNGQKGKMRSTLNSFYINMKIKKVQLNFFKSLLDTKAGQMLRVFRVWKEIPSRMTGPANKFQIKLQNFAFKRLRVFQDSMKFLFQEAENQKKRALQTLLLKTQSSYKRLFIEWKQMVYTDRMIRRCKLVINIFERVEQVIQANTQMLFTDDQKIRRMTAIVEKMIEQWKKKNYNYFFRWRQINHELKMEELLNDNNKKDMLKKMVDYVKRSSGNSHRFVLRQFYTNYKVKNIQQKIFKALFDTSAGKVLHLFMLWKGLPPPSDNEMQIKTVRFEGILHNFSMRPIKKSFQAFTRIYQEAISRKKSFFQSLQKKSMSSHKRMFINWHQIADNCKKVSRCKKTMMLFDIMNDLLSQKVEFALFSSLPDYDRKIRAMQKLIENYQRLRKEFWIMWKSRINDFRIKDEQKGEAIKQLEDLLDDKVKRQMKQALQSFDVDKKLQKIAFNLYKKLGVTSSQMALQLFLKWKYLPYRPPKTISHYFEEKMRGFVNNRNRQFLDCLKEIKSQADEKKKNLIILFLQNQKSKFQGVYDSWNYKREDQAVQKCSLTIKLFDAIHIKLQQQFGVIAESRNWDLMQKYLQRLINQQNLNIKFCLKQWRQHVFDSKIDLETKRRIIEKLNLMKEGSTLGGQRKVLNQFMKNRNIKIIQNQFFSKLLDTSVGKTLSLFQKWKSLPLPSSEKIKAQRFERLLNDFSGRRLRQFFDPLKQSLVKSQLIQKDSIYRLINLTMSDHKKLFLKWSNQTKQYKQNSKCRQTLNLFAILQEKLTERFHQAIENNRENNLKRKVIERLFEEQRRRTQNAFSTWSQLVRSVMQAEKCKRTIDFFEQMVVALRSRTDVILLNSQTVAIKKRALERLFEVTRSKTVRAFRTWYQYMLYNRLDDKQKRKMIDMLRNAITHSKGNKVRQAIQSFKKNASIRKYQIQFFNKILQSNIGQQILCFQKWKSLPIPVNFEERRKYASFQQRMANIYTNPIKQSLQALKDIKYVAEITKKKALYLMLKKTMGVPQRLYIKWKNVTQDEKRVEHFNAVSRFFEIVNQKITGSLENTIIEKTGSASHNQKIQKLVILFQRVESLYKKTLNDSMHMIQRKSGSVALRAYFASLWKWKFANLDSKYYTKYKQIYRQSAILSRFVQIVQARITNNLQDGYKEIKNFKKKSKEQLLLNCIGIRQREEVRLQSAWLNRWRQNVNLMRYQQNIMTVMIHQKLNSTVQILSRLLKQAAMNRIKNFVFTIRSNKSQQVENLVAVIKRARQRQLQSSFEAIRNESYSNRITRKLYLINRGLIKLCESNTIKQQLLAYAFDAIYDSAYDQNVNVWEQRTFQQMFCLSDIATSFNILKNLAFPQQDTQNSPPPSPPSTPINSRVNNNYMAPRHPEYNNSNQRNNQYLQQIPQQYQDNLSNSLTSSYQQPPEIRVTTSALVAQHLLEPSLQQSIQLNQNRNQPQIQEIEDNSISGILKKIGQDNLRIINRYGASDHIYSVLQRIFQRQKSSIFRQLVIKSKNKTVVELRFEQQKTKSQINDLQNSNRKLENQLQNSEINYQNKIQQLEQQLNSAIVKSESLLSQEKQQHQRYIQQLQQQNQQQQLELQDQRRQNQEMQQAIQQRLYEEDNQEADQLQRSSRHQSDQEEYERRSLHQLDQLEEEDQQRDNQYLNQVSDVQYTLQEMESRIQELMARDEEAQRQHQQILEDEQNYDHGEYNNNYSDQPQLSLRIRLQYADQNDPRYSNQQQQQSLLSQRSQQHQYFQSPASTQFRNDGNLSSRSQGYPYVTGDDQIDEDLIQYQNNMADQQPDEIQDLQNLNLQLTVTKINQLIRIFNDLRTRNYRFAFYKIKNQLYQSN